MKRRSCNKAPRVGVIVSAAALLVVMALLVAMALLGRTPASAEGGPSRPHPVDGAVSVTGSSALPEVPLEGRFPVTDERVFNAEAAVPPQCYTKTEGRFNPCYTCHQSYPRASRERMNRIDDGELQGAYSFSEVGVTNHFQNLFEDRTEWIASISDARIKSYVSTDNYTELAARLRSEQWQGFIPDLLGYASARAAFDARGLARDGSHWVAFNYKPFPGTFWPTNGSMDDVLIRLPAAFRELDGKFSADVYYVNLTLIELNLKGLRALTLWEVEEGPMGVDLNQDGVRTSTDQIARRDHYVGDAQDVRVEFEQLPVGTELLHSVRYLGVDERGAIFVPPRMKELRYMRKVNVLSASDLRSRYDEERKEKRLGRLPSYLSRGDEGLDNALGWYLKGFIEDYEGRLRPQTLEEDMSCMGCHKSISTTIDSTFSLARKVPGGRGFGYVNLVGMRDAPNISEDGGEILNYLRRVGGGSEFRANPEMRQRWFLADGTVKVDRVATSDVATLLLPSSHRALSLNKAYTHIVRHQSYRLGRDALPTPAQNVYREIDETAVVLKRPHRHHGWDIRLDWAR